MTQLPIPRLGWVGSGAPVQALPELAASLGLASLAIKRDDALEALFGGTKVRKLDTLLASPRFRDATAWHSVGALGSGHLVAVTAAAERLDKRMHAHLFHTPPGPHALENLAYVASYATKLHDHGSRLRLALLSPRLILGGAISGAPVVPPGGTCAAGILGMVDAGLELAEDVRSGRTPWPDRVYVAFGTGGTAVGLSVGLALGGLGAVVVHAIAVVERALVSARRCRRLQAETLALLGSHGVSLPASLSPCRLVFDFGCLGRGYAHDTPAGLAAMARLESLGVPSDPTYTGKAMAALLRDASLSPGASWLFWNTQRGREPPCLPDWRERLPESVRRCLPAPTPPRPGDLSPPREAAPTRPRQETRAPPRRDQGRGLSRRGLLAGLGAGAALLAVSVERLRLPPLDGWRGLALSAGEASILVAVAEVVLPRDADTRVVAAGADRYVASLPRDLRRQLGLLLYAIEQAPAPLGVSPSRFSALELPARDRLLIKLALRGGLWTAAYHGVRDLCLVGYYQHESSWRALGYSGPMVAGLPAVSRSELLAPPGALPRAATGATGAAP